MEFHPLQTEVDYQAVLKEISTLMDQDPEEGTPDGDRLNALVSLVQVYEAKHYPIASPDLSN
jgi:HTH-type transcriptional regulator/antitoxin HigA